MNEQNPVSYMKDDDLDGNEQSTTFILYTDGASSKNGSADSMAGCGGALFVSDCHEPIMTFQHFLGHSTNNAAEYQGLIIGLELAACMRIRSIEVRMDSQLIINQVQDQHITLNYHLNSLRE